MTLAFSSAPAFLETGPPLSLFQPTLPPTKKECVSSKPHRISLPNIEIFYDSITAKASCVIS
jgi:hypothetical protein